MNNYLNIDEKELSASIYRFTSVDHLLRLINKRQNILVSPRKWEDPFEDILSKIKFIKDNGEIYKHPFHDRVYGQCWTTKTEETDAAWRMYIPNRNGVRLKTTINKLYQSLVDAKETSYEETHCYIGRVEYKTEEQLRSCLKDKNWVQNNLLNIGCPKQAESLLFKRAEFTPEKEIRLIYLEPYNKGDDDYFHYGMNPSVVIDEITFDPRMKDGLYETYKTIIHKLGFSGAVNKSQLYQIPVLEIFI